MEYQRQFESESRQKQFTGQSRSAETEEQVSPLSDNQNAELDEQVCTHNCFFKEVSLWARGYIRIYSLPKEEGLTLE